MLSWRKIFRCHTSRRASIPEKRQKKQSDQKDGQTNPHIIRLSNLQRLKQPPRKKMIGETFYEISMYTKLLENESKRYRGWNENELSSFQQTDDATLTVGDIDSQTTGIKIRWNGPDGIVYQFCIPSTFIQGYSLRKVVSSSGRHRGIVLDIKSPLPVYHGNLGHESVLPGFDASKSDSSDSWKVTFKIIGQEDYNRLRKALRAYGMKNPCAFF
jgi:hypothetical protein